MKYLIFLLLISCGTENENNSSSTIKENKTEPEDTTIQSITLKSRKHLKGCDSKSEGTLAYILDEKVFVTCSDGEWVDVDIGGNDSDSLNNFNLFTDPRNGDVYFYYPNTVVASLAVCPIEYSLISGSSVSDVYLNVLKPQSPMMTYSQPIFSDVSNIANAFAYNNLTGATISTASAHFLCKKT